MNQHSTNITLKGACLAVVASIPGALHETRVHYNYAKTKNQEVKVMSETTQLQLQIEALRKENAELRALLEMQNLDNVWVGLPDPVETYVAIGQPEEYIPYFSDFEG